MSIEVNNESGVQVDEAQLVALARFVFEQPVHPSRRPSCPSCWWTSPPWRSSTSN